MKNKKIKSPNIAIFDIAILPFDHWKFFFLRSLQEFLVEVKRVQRKVSENSGPRQLSLS